MPSLADELRTKFDWDDIPYLTAGYRDFNVEQHFPLMLKKILPGFDFGFFTPDDMDDRKTKGWVPLKPEYLGDDWRSHAPLKFTTELSDKGGYLKFKNKILCFMPTDKRVQVRRKMNERAETRYRAVAKGVKETRQVDGRIKVAESELELKKQLAGHEVEDDIIKRRGRPPKNRSLIESD